MIPTVRDSRADHIDALYDYVDVLCYLSMWEEIDALFHREPDDAAIDVALLTITNCVKSKLKHRKHFYNKVWYANEEHAERLLKGLE